MKMSRKIFILRSALAIACIVCIAFSEKSRPPATHAMPKETTIPSADAMPKELSIPSADAMPKETSIPSTDASTTKKSDLPSTDRQKDNWQNHLGYAVPEDDDPENAIQTDADEIALAISSEDHKYTIFVKRDDRQKFYIYNTEEDKLDQINVTPDLATDIMSLEWIKPDKLAVWSHVNPSLGCLDIYDVNSLQKLTEKYCLFYSLAEGIDSLIYTVPAPHFSSTIGKETIQNIDDEILYQTEKNEIISSIANNENGDIAIVIDKKDEGYETKSTDLVVLKEKGKKYKVSEKISLAKKSIEEIHWIDKHKISYSTRNGKNKVLTLKSP